MASNGSFVSIIIVGYNSEKYLRQCLNSVYSQDYKNFEAIFIDNASNDRTLLIARSYPDIKIIENIKNMGFSYAVNQGIEKAGSEFILTLNTDVILERNFLIEMKNAAGSGKIGLFSGKILRYDADDRRMIDSTGLVLSGFNRFFDRGHGEPDRGQYDQKLDIFGPSAAAALYRREMLEDIKHNGKYFDEDFFFTLEDVDLAYRARLKKWGSRYVPSAVCYHKRNGSNMDRRYRQYLSFRNRYFLLIKNNRINAGYSIIFIFYDVPRFIYMLFTNKYTLKALHEVIQYRLKCRGAS